MATLSWITLCQNGSTFVFRSQQSVSGVMREVLKSAEFIRSSSDRRTTESSRDGILNDVEITSHGFKFLLMERSQQVWTYLIAYLRNIGNFQFIHITGAKLQLFRAWKYHLTSKADLSFEPQNEGVNFSSRFTGLRLGPTLGTRSRQQTYVCTIE